jgi:hypothetical protein
MTILWSPDRFGRSTAPRVSIIAGPGGFRDEHWREVRRRIDPQEELARWYRETWWSGFALGAGLVVVGTLLGLAIAFDWTWDALIEAALRIRS